MADINIGTAEAPLYVPEGSAGAQNYQQNINPNNATIDPAKPVSGSDLGKTTNYPSNPATSDVNAFVGSIDGLLKASQTPEVAAAEKTQSDLTTKLGSAYDALGSKSARLQQEEDKYGVMADVKALKDLNLQIAQRTGEFNAAYEKAGNQPILTDITDRQQNAIRRQQAVEIGALSARAAALQGNIELSQKLAERTVNIEFESKENEIKKLETFLQLNRDNLSRAEQKQAQRLQLIVDKQKSELAEQKEYRQMAIEYGITAPFMNVGGTIVRTSDGKAFPTKEAYFAASGKTNFDGIPQVTKQSVEERQYVQDLRSKYIDAGISYTDTPETAAAKIRSNSAIYREQVRPPSSGGGGQSQARTNILSAATNRLNAQRAASEDGKSNPNDYRREMAAYVAAGGSRSDFLAELPISDFIAPSNQKGDLAPSLGKTDSKQQLILQALSGYAVPSKP